MPHIVAKRRYTFRRRRLWIPSSPPVVGGTAVAVFFHHLATQGDDKVMMLRQSTASQEILLGPFVDSTDGNTAETALTIANTDIKIFKDGATTLADKNSGGATHISNGYYSAVLDATDTNTVGQLEVHVKVAGALAVMRKYQVVEEAVYDALFAASAAGYQVPIWASVSSTVNLSGTTVKAVTDRVTANTDQWNGTAVTSATVRSDLINIAGVAVSTSTAQLGVNVVNFGGSAGTFSSGRPEVNASHWGGTAVASALVRGNLIQVNGSATPVTNIATVFDTDFALNYDAVDDRWIVDVASIRGESVTHSGAFDFDTLKTAYQNVNTYLDTSISSRMATYTQPTGFLAATFPTTVASPTNITAGTITTVTNVTTVNGIAANAITASSLATDAVDEIADGVWNEPLSGHLTAGSTGNALNAAGSAGDPWSTSLPGAYGAGSAGYIIGTNLNATVSSRSSHSASDVWASGTRTLTALDEDSTTLDLDATIRAAVGMASANLDTQLDALPTAAENTTAVWAAVTRTLTTTFPTNFGSMVISAGGVVSADAVAVSGDSTAADNLESYLDGTHFMPVDAHKPVFSISGATLTVKRPDGTTTAYTRTLTTNASADPVTGSS